MKLFKYLTVASVVQGGAMFAANEDERNCMRDCKNARDCRGESATDDNDSPAECVIQCRKECLPRKDLLRSHFAPDKRQHHADKKHQRKIERISERILRKQANPPPLMKSINQMIEDGEIPARFGDCLEREKDALECAGQGKEFWPCKRQMIQNCLEQYGFFENLNNEEVAELLKDIETNAENMVEALAEIEAEGAMQMDAVEEDPEEKLQMLHDSIKENGRAEDKVDLSAALEKIKYRPSFETRPEEAEEEEEEEEEEEPEYEEEEEEEEEETGMLGDVGLYGSQQFYSREYEDEEEEEEAAESPRVLKEEPEQKVEAVFSIRSKNNNGRPDNSPVIKHKHQFYAAIADNLTQDELVNAMCSCRTSMEPFRINNYLKKHGMAIEWHHHEDTCKWCVFSKSKKCSNCIKYWENQEGTDAQVISNNCETFKEALRNPKIDFSMPKPDPCPMKNLHNGKFNEYQKEGEFAANYESFKQLYKNGGNMPKPAH